MKYTGSELVYSAFVYVFITFAGIITLYPFLYVIAMAFSMPDAVLTNKVWLYPVGFNINAFAFVLSGKDFWGYYYNTIWYTVVGTVLNVIFTVMAGYPISRRQFFLRRPITFFYTLTMFINGGLIANYLLVAKWLNLYNSRWALILPTLIGVWNLLICRAFFMSLPEELFECARIEGAGEGRVIIKIVVPLSKPIISVLALYYAVGHWNSFFPALLYLSKLSLMPVQIYLRRMLIMGDTENINREAMMFLQIRYAIILVSILPILSVYPFIQKYFVKGVLIGSVKG